MAEALFTRPIPVGRLLVARPGHPPSEEVRASPPRRPVLWLLPALIIVAFGPVVLTAIGLLAVALRPQPQAVTETIHLPPAPAETLQPRPEANSVAEVTVEPGEARPLPRGFQPAALSKATDPPEPARCDRFGTQIDFVRSPAIAFDRAGLEGKLVMVLHLAGHFEDPGFT
jgi:hypothetical protein